MDIPDPQKPDDGITQRHLSFEPPLPGKRMQTPQQQHVEVPGEKGMAVAGVEFLAVNQEQGRVERAHRLREVPIHHQIVQAQWYIHGVLRPLASHRRLAAAGLPQLLSKRSEPFIV